ncbi:MAG: asparagine synthase-related protein [Rudaea sp.]|uniref:asparagine synthase-related protein n=1 Tax=Rudaea sp. TaxID=2136325 RepID=UPI0039E24705
MAKQTGILQQQRDGDAHERALLRAREPDVGKRCLENGVRGTFRNHQKVFRKVSPESVSDTVFPNSFRSVINLAQQRGATAIFSGSMGDAVFGRAEPLLAAAEYVRRHGIRPGLFRVAYDVALRQRLSVWRVLGFALYAGLLRPPRGPWSHYMYEKSRSSHDSYLHGRMLTPEAVSQFERELQRFVHPWLQRAEQLSIGNLMLISILTLEMPYELPFICRTDPPIVRPLTGQPLVECSLRVESFLNVAGGWDRAVARLAFANDLPADVIRRNTKGGPSRTIREVIDKNVLLIREMLLDGILVKEKLLDPKQIEAALPTVPTKEPSRTGALMHHLYIEAWLQHWTANAQQRA